MTDSPETKIARLEERMQRDREHADTQHKALMDALEAMSVRISADMNEAIRRCSIRHKKRCPGEKLRRAQELAKTEWISVDTVKKALIGIGIIGTLFGGAWQAVHGDDAPKAAPLIISGGNK